MSFYSSTSNARLCKQIEASFKYGHTVCSLEIKTVNYKCCYFLPGGRILSKSLISLTSSLWGSSLIQIELPKTSLACGFAGELYCTSCSRSAMDWEPCYSQCSCITELMVPNLWYTNSDESSVEHVLSVHPQTGTPNCKDCFETLPIEPLKSRDSSYKATV